MSLVELYWLGSNIRLPVIKSPPEIPAGTAPDAKEVMPVICPDQDIYDVASALNGHVINDPKTSIINATALVERIIAHPILSVIGTRFKITTR